MPRLPIIAALILHTSVAVCAGTTPAMARIESNKQQRWKSAAVQALIHRDDANALATAAALSFSANDPKSHSDFAKSESIPMELIARATDLVPDSATLAWMRVRLCLNTPGCDTRDAATALRWVDPDNAAAWLPRLAAALHDKDTVQVDRILADMAQGTRFDVYWNRIVVILYDSLRGVSKTLPANEVDADAGRLRFVVGVAASEFVPTFASLQEACRESTAGSERRESCVKIAKGLQQGDTVAAQVVGLNLEKRFLPADGKEYRALVERRRVLEWRVETAAKYDVPLLPWVRNAHARWRLARMRGLKREEDVLLAVLREQGSPIDPPDAAH
jgi:hypothetical protein